MRKTARDITDIFIDRFSEEDFEESYEEMIADFSDQCCSASLSSEILRELSDKADTYDFTGLPESVQEQIELYKNRLGAKLYRRSLLLYDVAHSHCGRAAANGIAAKDILSMAKRRALSLLDKEDPFGNVEQSPQYMQIQDELDSLDFSDLPRDVIMRILHLTADIIQDQTYLSAVLYYMATRNCLRFLEKWGVVSPKAARKTRS